MFAPSEFAPNFQGTLTAFAPRIFLLEYLASFAHNEFRPHCFAQNENGLEWISTRYTHVFSALASGRSASWAKPAASIDTTPEILLFRYYCYSLSHTFICIVSLPQKEIRSLGFSFHKVSTIFETSHCNFFK